MPAIPNFPNIKELKRYLIQQKKKKVKYTAKELKDAKDKVKPKK
jgi:hypothetical protein